MSIRRKPIVIAGLAAASLLLTSCAGSGPAIDKDVGGGNAEFAKLYAAAMESGQTEIVGYVPNPAAFKSIAERFEEEYPGLTVDLSALYGPELESRLQSEAQTTGIQADFTNLGEGELVNFAKNGWFESYLPTRGSELDDNFVGPEKQWFTPNLNVQGPVYNTELLEEGDVPKTWTDLVAPSRAGTLAMESYDKGGFPLATLGADRAGVIDESWVEGLAAAKPTMYSTFAETLQSVVAGQTTLYPVAPYVIYHQAAEKGAPLKFVWLEDGNAAFSDSVALFKDAPNPDAAKLWLSWLLEPEAQELAVAGGRAGTMPGTPSLPGMGELVLTSRESIQDEYVDWIATLRSILK